ncbi:MAG: hypothetical protein KC561_03360, partial [Myxococcales bacterium]|nr:hypothetical protein [Myxococcales bacterium]
MDNSCQSGCRADNPTTEIDEDTCRDSSAPHLSCSTASRACQPQVCEVGDEETCPSGSVCDDGRCRIGCRSDLECGDGGVCDLDAMRCVCDTSEDCGDGSVCSEMACIPACTVNADCPGGFCNLGTGLCFQGCVQDRLEPVNDRPLNGVGVDSGEIVTGTLCGADTDWFGIEAETGNTIRATFYPSAGELTLALFGDDALTASDPLQSVTVTVEESGQPVELTRIVDSSECSGSCDYFVRLTGVGEDTDGKAIISYSGVIDIFGSDSCLPDRFEDDDDFDSAVTLNEGSSANRTICSGDAGDYLSFNVPASTIATVTLQSAATTSVLDLSVYDGSRQLVQSATGSQATKVLVVGPFSEQVTYFAVVTPDSEADSQGYSIALSFEEAGVCADDAREPADDTRNTSPLLALEMGGAAQNITALSACDGDDDWFRFNAPQGARLDLDLSSPFACDLEVALYSPTGSQLKKSTGVVTNFESDPFASAGEWAIRVRTQACPDGVLGTGYAVNLQLLAPVCTDEYEGNDAALAASLIFSDPGFGTALSFDTNTAASGTPLLCRDDSDWYRFTLQRPATIQATLESTSLLTSFSMSLYDADDVETALVTSTQRSATSIGVVNVELEPGDYLVAVRQKDNTYLPLDGKSYRLTVSAALEELTCIDPGRESNDSLVTAWTVSAAQACPSEDVGDEDYYCERLCDQDVDYYWIPLFGPSAITVSVDFENASPNTLSTLQLYSNGVARIVDGPDSGDATLTASSTATDSGAILQVRHQSGSGSAQPYRFSVQTEGLDICQPQSNIGQGSAKTLSSDETRSGRLCGTSSLWYRVLTQQNTQYTATLTPGSATSLRMILWAYEDDSLVQLDQRTATNGPATSTVSDIEGGLWVEVRAATPTSGTDETFELAFSAEVNPICTDRFEPNDSELGGAAMGTGIDPAALACAGDDDWYLFEVADDAQTVTFTFTQLDVSHPLWVEILDDQGASLASASNTAAEKTFQLLLDSGTYSVHVSTDSDGPVAGIPYTVEIAFEPPACTDVLEPNNLEGSATVLGSTDALWSGLRLCPDDEDWFSFNVPTPGSDIDLSVEFMRPASVIPESTTVQVFDSGGGTLDSATGTDPVAVHLDSAAAGQYTVRLAPTTTLTRPVQYNIAVSQTPPFICTDQREDDDDPEHATVLTSTLGVSGRACEGDEDFFTVNVPYSHVTLDVALSGYDGELAAPVVAILFGETVLDSGTSATAQVAAGTYYFRVSLPTDESGQGQPYTLTWSATPAGCLVDAFEENDSASAPSLALPGSSTQLFVCSGDDDFYAISLGSAGDSLQVVLTQDQATDVRLAVLNDAEQELMAIQNAGLVKSLNLVTPGAGDYLIAITQAGGAIDYHLDVQVSADPCAPDVFEDNDSSDQASPAHTGAASLCAGDEDWYGLPVVSSDALLFVEIEAEAGSFELTIFEEDGETVVASCFGSDIVPDGEGGYSCAEALSTSPTTATSVMVPAAPIGSYYLRVQSAGTPPETGWPYRPTFDIVERGCFNDLNEPNDVLEDAAVPVSDEGGLLSSNERSNLRICGDEDDFLVLTVSGTVALQAVSAEGPVELCTVDEAGDSIECAVSQGNSDWLVTAGDEEPHQVTVRIRALSTPIVTGMGYTFRYRLLDPCSDDPFEGGADEQDMSPINLAAVESGPTTMRLCPGDTDRFLIRPTVSPETCTVGGDPTCWACLADDPAPCSVGAGFRSTVASMDVTVEAEPQSISSAL